MVLGGLHVCLCQLLLLGNLYELLLVELLQLLRVGQQLVHRHGDDLAGGAGRAEHVHR